MVDRRKEFKQRLSRMNDEEIEELASDLVDFADRKGTGELRNFIIDPQLRVILEDMDKDQLRAAIRRSASTAAISTGVTALLTGLTTGPAESLGSAVSALPLGLAGGYAAGKKQEKIRKVVEVLTRIKAQAGG